MEQNKMEKQGKIERMVNSFNERRKLPRARKLIKKGYKGLDEWSEEDAIDLVEYLTENHPHYFKNPKELAAIAMAEVCHIMEVSSIVFTGEDTSKCSEEDWKKFIDGCMERSIRDGSNRVPHLNTPEEYDSFYRDIKDLYHKLDDKGVFSDYLDMKYKQREMVRGGKK